MTFSPELESGEPVVYEDQLKADERDGTRKLAVIICMDPRLDPLAILGIPVGKIAVISVAGGRASAAERSILAAFELLHITEFLIIHHTNCGMASVTDEQLRDALASNHDITTDVPFLTIRKLRESLQQDVSYVCKLLANSPVQVRIVGLTYNVSEEPGMLKRRLEAYNHD